MDVRPLSPKTWDALAELFREGGDPRWCWCQFWRLRSKDMRDLKVPELRERLQAQAVVAAEAAEAAGGDEATGAAGAAADRAKDSEEPGREEPPGLVAFDDDGRAVGWISLGPRDAYARITHSKVIPKIDDRPVWSVVCFAVSARARGRGVARTLLEAGVAFARSRGAVALEAYPVAIEAGEPIHAESAFTGTLPMFRRLGFEVVAERASDPSSRHPRVVVRLEL